MIRSATIGGRLWAFAVWAVTGLFVLNLVGVIATVVLDSFATRWLGTWLPAGWTGRWYGSAWDEFQLGDVLFQTFEVAFLVVAIAGVVGTLAAYALARRNFPGKRGVVLLVLLPMLIPPITYGIPLATVLYQVGLGGTLSGVVAANLVPTVPFVVLIMVPFIEQVDIKIEAAARVFGAGPFKLFWYVLLPLLLPGVMAALLLVLVRTVAMFELSFLVSGPDRQTLVVALYYAVFAAGVRRRSPWMRWRWFTW